MSLKTLKRVQARMSESGPEGQSGAVASEAAVPTIVGVQVTRNSVQLMVEALQEVMKSGSLSAIANAALALQRGRRLENVLEESFASRAEDLLDEALRRSDVRKAIREQEIDLGRQIRYRL